MTKSRDTISCSPFTIVCIGLVFSAIAAYLYFLNLSVVEVVIRTELKQEQQLLNTEIAELESRYIMAQHKIAAQVATLDGYSSDTPKVFVSRGEAQFVLGGE
jgi:hypothetical protein